MSEILELAKKNKNAGIQYLKHMNSLLGEDVNTCMKRLKLMEDRKEILSKKAEFDFWVRTLIRAFFSHIEGVCYAMRSIVLWAQERGEISLSDVEIQFLEEVDETGKKRFKGPIDNMDLAFKYFSRLFGCEYKPDKSDSRSWTAFKRSLNDRHEITHPKDPGELIISPDKYLRFRDAILWFNGAMRGLFQVILKTQN